MAQCLSVRRRGLLSGKHIHRGDAGASRLNGRAVRGDSDVSWHGVPNVSRETEGATNTTVWKFEPIPDGTLVTAVLEAEPKGLTRVLGPLAKLQVQRLLRECLRDLAKYVEAK